MKHTVKRALALFIALLLAMPTYAFAEAPEGPVVVIENASDAADQEEIIASVDIDPPVAEAEAFQLGDPDEPVDQDPGIIEGLTLDPEEPGDTVAGDDTVAGEDVSVYDSPFDQTVTVGEATFNVTAQAGVFPDGATLRVFAEESDEVTRGVEAALGTAGVYTHRLYRVEVLDASDNIILPDIEQGKPVLRAEGLNLPEDARVMMYDEAQDLFFDIDATIEADGNAIAFSLCDMTVYDILSIEPSPTEEEPTEATAEQPAEDESVQPVSVLFDTVPESAIVTVYATQKPSPLGQYRTIRRHVWRCLFCRASLADFLIYLQ